jgi:ureidoglycolate lyase
MALSTMTTRSLSTVVDDPISQRQIIDIPLQKARHEPLGFIRSKGEYHIRLMKLLRYGLPGKEKPALLDSQGGIRDLSGTIPDLSGETLRPGELSRLSRLDPCDLPLVEESVRVGPCVGNPGKFICIGLNYSDHAAESGMAVPEYPVVFFKATSAICGPYDDVEIPRDSLKTDWEVELGVIIGERAKYVDGKRALEHVAGFCVVNDLSERHFQLEQGGQWVKGKSHDSFGPIGPWLVTRDEVPDFQNLDLWLEVDGHRYQSGNTSKMVFTVAELITYLSNFMTLHPGDIISTGTPPGVGLGQKPEPVFLREGQEMRLSVEGLGEQRQRTVRWRSFGQA